MTQAHVINIGKLSLTQLRQIDPLLVLAWLNGKPEWLRRQITATLFA